MNSLDILKDAYIATSGEGGLGSYAFDPNNIDKSGDPSDWTARYLTGFVIPYVASPEWTTPVGSPSTFVSPMLIDIGTSGQMSQTKVWRKTTGRDIKICRLLDVGAPNWYRQKRTVDIEYKDPCVIKLPDEMIGGWPKAGGWLMILARYMMVAVDEDESGETTASSPDPSNSLASIVCWWSDTEDFVGENVIGPIHLVDGANAWQDDVYIRHWIGTPGAVVVETSPGEYELFVYYSVDLTSLGYGSVGGPEAINDMVDVADYGATNRSIDFDVSVVCKRIPLVYLSNFLVYEDAYVDDAIPGLRFPLTSEETWEPDRIILGGSLLGGIRVWLPNGRIVGRSHSVRSFFDDYLPSVRFADAAPLRCGAEDDLASLSLVVAANVLSDAARVVYPVETADSTGLGSGHGLWRFRAIMEGTRLFDSGGSGRYVATYGKDFLAADQVAYRSPDQLVEDDQDTSYNYTCFELNGTSDLFASGLHIRLDGDPVILEDGSVRISYGAAMVDVAMLTSDPFPFGDIAMLEGSAADCTATADDILDLDTPVAIREPVVVVVKSPFG